MSRRVAELAEVALGNIAAEKAEVPTALYAETSACLLCDLCRTKGACELSLTRLVLSPLGELEGASLCALRLCVRTKPIKKYNIAKCQNARGCTAKRTLISIKTRNFALEIKRQRLTIHFDL